MSRRVFDSADHISFSVKIGHLRAWYQAPEAVYVVLYIEAADVFLAEDVRDVVRRRWGDELLHDAMFEPGQATTTVKMLTTARVDGSFWTRLQGHRSMRSDGRMFRGRPLGHDLDPLRTTLNPMAPVLFEEVVRDLLLEHGFRRTEELDAGALFARASHENRATLEQGVLHEKFEIVLQFTTEKIPDCEDGFRNEGDSDWAQGPCAVFIHSSVAAPPSVRGLRALAAGLIRKRKITRLLAFVNASFRGEVRCFAAFTEALAHNRIRCRPQHLEDISFNFLTTTNTYNRFRDKVSYWGHKLWRQENGPFYLLDPSGGPLIPFD